MPETSKNALWRSMPPAVFPAILGLAGLGLSWVVGGPLVGAGKAVGFAILALAFLLYSAAAAAYLAKIFARPAVFFEDLGAIPGRLGLAAMAICLMLFANGLVGVSAPLARVLVFAGLGALGLVSILAAVQLMRASGMARQVTPVWHLTFVGYVVSAPALAQLSHNTLTLWVLGLTFIAALGIYGFSLEQGRATPMPEPMRPAHMIHLAPISFFGTSAVLINLHGTALALGWIATAIAVVLALRLRFMMAGGFSPFYGAFTFPVAAYSGMLLTLAPHSVVFKWLGLALMCAMTLYVPLIVGRILRMCWDGRLAKATNPAQA